MTEGNEVNENKEPIETTDNNQDAAISLSKVIDGYIHRVLDVEDCAREFITTARKNFNSNAERLKSEITESQNIIENETNPDNRLIGVRKIRKCLRELDRHNKSDPSTVLEKSLFISLFSSFDKYVGDLISVLYSRKPELYKNLNREIPLNEILDHESIESLRAVVLDKEIETVRRKSYSEQFSDLEKRFSITLRKFDKWPNFIECSQRRNLFTHCDGVVSKQYIDACKAANYKFTEEPNVGTQLGIGAKYFFEASRLLTEVAVMLGHTLWRKVDPRDISEADSNLSRHIFDFLHMEHWNKAISLSQFSLSLPKISDDKMERIFTVNYAIALKAIGRQAAAKKILEKRLECNVIRFSFGICSLK